MQSDRSGLILGFFVLLALGFGGFEPASAQVPGNDEISGAILIPALPFVTIEYISQATGNVDDPVHACTGSRDHATVWFRFVANFTGTVGAIADDNGFSVTVLSAYPGSTSAGPALGCDISRDDGPPAEISFAVSSGQSYLIELSIIDRTNFGDEPTLIVTEGGPCRYSFSPPSQSFPASGGANIVSVITGPGAGCPWSIHSDADWITITSADSGVGSGTVSYSVQAGNGTDRIGILRLSIAEQRFMVNQSATEKKRRGQITSQ